MKKPGFIMLDALVFWILFSCISEKLMPRAKADFTKNNSFKAFSGFWQGNPLIQPQYTTDSQIFRAKQGGYPNPMPTSDSIPTSFSPVTHRDGLCAGFKTQFGKDVPWSKYSGSLSQCGAEVFLPKLTNNRSLVLPYYSREEKWNQTLFSLLS